MPAPVRRCPGDSYLDYPNPLGATVVATGEPFASAYIMVITVRDGLIVHSRDYGIPVAAA